VLVQGRNLRGQFSDFSFEHSATLSDIFDFLLETCHFLLITFHISDKHECKILHDIRLTLRLAGSLGGNDVVIRLDLLIDLVDHGADLKQESVGVLEGDGF